VLLAVRVKSMPGELVGEPLDDEERGEDNASIDGHVSGFRFEYVDATSDGDSSQQRQDEFESDGE
jgi:hypothetical protein